VLFEVFDHGDHLLSEVSLGGTGTHSLEGEAVLSVVVGLGVPFGSFGINILSELSELFHGGVVEKVSVSGELGSGVLELGKVEVSVLGLGDDGDDLVLQEGDNLEGFLVLLEGLDEHKVGVTSLFSEVFSLLVDVVSSVVDPSKVFSGNLNLVLEVLSVGGGLVTNLLVRVGDEG